MRAARSLPPLAAFLFPAFAAAMLGLAAARADNRAAAGKEKEAAELYRAARALELRGDAGSAIRKFERVVKLYPETAAAPASQYEIARLHRAEGEYENAFIAYQQVIDLFPASPRFLDVLRGQFEIASEILARHELKKRRPDTVLPPAFPKPPVVREMLEKLIANAKQSEFSPLARFLLAASYQATEDEGDSARPIWEKLVDDHGESDLADDAAFQLAYIDYERGTANGVHRGFLVKARMAFDEFLLKFPSSDKAPVAAHFQREIDREELRYLLGTAEYYEARGKPGAAGLYYGDAAKLLGRIGEQRLPPDLKARSAGVEAKWRALRDLAPETPGEESAEGPGPPAIIRNRTTGETIQLD